MFIIITVKRDVLWLKFLRALQLDFLSEAELMKRFDHKNIVKLLGVCTRGEPVYAVMEFMLHGLLFEAY